MSMKTEPTGPPAFSLLSSMQSKPIREVQRALKSLSSVQLAVQRSLASTRDLDERFQTAQTKAETSAASYLEDMSCSEPDPERLRQVRAEQRAAILVADKKVSLVSEAHDTVERQIERLDTALAQFQHEFSACGGVGGLPGSLSPGTSRAVDTQGSRGRRACADSANPPADGQLFVDPPEVEETFCTCGRVSFGEMVGCDNPSCASQCIPPHSPQSAEEHIS